MEDALVFLDSAYLDKITIALGGGIRIRIEYIPFCSYLANLRGLNCKRIYYYCAPPYQNEAPTVDQRRRRKGYDNFVGYMEIKYRNYFIIREGHLIQLFEKTLQESFRPIYHQKGVDTWLTMDLLEEPFKEKVKTIILIASDGDFVPVIDRIQQRGIKPILFYYFNYSIEPKTVVSQKLLEQIGNANAFVLKKEDLDKNIHIPSTP